MTKFSNHFYVNNIEFPIIILKNGLRIINFSSPHEFIFTDDSILSAQSDSNAEKLKVEFKETITVTEINGVQVENVSLDFELTDIVRSMLYLLGLSNIKDQFDICIIPLPMLTAMKKDLPFNVCNSPFRSVRMNNRLEKRVEVSRFCI